MRIGVDLMGSDRPPEALFDAVLQAARQIDPASSLLVFTAKEFIEGFALLAARNLNGPAARIDFFPAAEIIDMRDEPIVIRRKKKSSLVLGIKQIKKKKIDAFVSAGNTGALIAATTLMLPALPSIRRPALLTTLPTESGNVAIVDVGGNVSCKPHHMIQFAEMGAAYQRCQEGIEIPRIGLLNIGIESKKGTLQLQQTYQLLKEREQKGDIKFVGNVEGRDLFLGKIDLLVTDGFSGNVLLKTSEGVALYILDIIKKALGHLSNSQLQHALSELQRHFNYAEYPGAIVLGIDGVVVKCHGDASSKALLNGIKGAIKLVEKQLVAKIKLQLMS